MCEEQTCMLLISMLFMSLLNPRTESLCLINKSFKLVLWTGSIDSLTQKNNFIHKSDVATLRATNMNRQIHERGDVKKIVCSSHKTTETFSEDWEYSAQVL